MSIKIYVNDKENDCMLEEHGYWFRIYMWRNSETLEIISLYWYKEREAPCSEHCSGGKHYWRTVKNV